VKVKEILEKKGSAKVWTVAPETTIHDALGILVNQKIGACVVLNQKEELVGIVSERDITRECYRRGQYLESTPASQIMTKKVLVGKMDDKIDYIMGIMTNNRIRHVPIVDEQHKLVGMISIGDVVKAQLQDTEYENRYLKEYMFGPETG